MGAYLTEEVLAKFPHKQLPRCDGEPNYEAIHEIMMAMYANAGAIPTTLGGGAHGHIRLIMDVTQYATLSGTPYVTPTAPVRGVLPTRATLVDRDVIKQTYNHEKAIYDNHNTVDEILKTQLQEAVEDIYLAQLRNHFTAYLGGTTKDMLDHLLD